MVDIFAKDFNLRKLFAKLVGRTFSRFLNSSHNTCAVLLWGPDHGDLTSYTSEWLQELAVRLKLVDHICIGQIVSKECIAASLQTTKKVKRVKVFFGHGDSETLFGPPSNERLNIARLGRARTVLYDLNTIEAVESEGSSLFAFCCRAGLGLGKSYGAMERRAFLGYQVDIPLEINNKQCVESWKRIVHTITIEIIMAGGIYPDHKARLENLYRHELDLFLSGDEKYNDRNLLMMMYLKRHMDNICYHGTLI